MSRRAVPPRDSDDAPSSSAGSDDEQPRVGTSSRYTTIVAQVAAQTALLSAALFYFGWVRANATFAYFGIDVALLDFSTTDYLLRSINSAFAPLLVVALLLLASDVVRRNVVELAGFGGNYQRFVRSTPVIAVVGAAVLLVVALAGITVRRIGESLGVWLPITLAVGASLLLSADGAWSLLRGGRRPRSDVRAYVLSFLVLLGALWTIAEYAERVGENRAKLFAERLSTSTELVIASREPLHLTGPGVTVSHASSPGVAHGWRYAGLRLLADGRTRLFVLPAGWKRGAGSAYAIPDTPEIRIEFRRR